MVAAIRTADEGGLITKRKIQVVTRKFITKKTQTTMKRTIIKRLGVKKMKKMGKKKVLIVVKRELRKEAIR